MRVATISGIDHYLPRGRLTNQQLAELYPAWTAARIMAKTGISERSVAAQGETVIDMAATAAERLIKSRMVDRSEIDLLILCTQTPDLPIPTNACILQDRLGLSTSLAAFDINLGCSAFPYGVAIAQSLIESGVASCAMFVASETYSRWIHPMDKSVRTLFGDAASAVLIRSVEDTQPVLGPHILGTDGSGARNLMVPQRPGTPGADAELQDESGNIRTPANLYMNGPAIMEFTLRRVPEIVAQLLDRAGLRIEDIDHFVFHQANESMLRFLQRKLRIPDDRFPIHLAHCGNTVSSTIPIVLQQLVTDGRLRPGHRVMTVGFGVGYSWGASLIRWGAEH